MNPIIKRVDGRRKYFRKTAYARDRRYKSRSKKHLESVQISDISAKREKGCLRKTRYCSLTEAARIAMIYVRRPYRCEFCYGWHLTSSYATEWMERRAREYESLEENVCDG